MPGTAPRPAPGAVRSAPGAPRAVQAGLNDQLFAAAAGAAGMAEIATSQLAAGRSTNDEVKKFAQHMIADHGKASRDLMALAAARQIPLPKTLQFTDAAAVEALSLLRGEEFDREYVNNQVAAHMCAVQLFRAEAAHGRDAQVKALAAKTLPTLEEHLKMAQDLASRTAGEPAPGEAPKAEAAPGLAPGDEPKAEPAPVPAPGEAAPKTEAAPGEEAPKVEAAPGTEPAPGIEAAPGTEPAPKDETTPKAPE